MFKNGRNDHETGVALIDMLDGCQHRGRDSTGFALYGEERRNELKLRFLVGEGAVANESEALIKTALETHDAEIVDDKRVGNTYQAVVKFDGDLRKFAYAMEHAAPDAKVISIGQSLDIVKDVGGAHDVDDRFDVHEFKGSHGLGHVRLATESDVRPESAHPFWATGFSDVAIVHNGQITNYWKMRRRL
ncbi:MAG: amidophosphoribosyltransferase, partial [Alphaproteobacteria bacterium]